MEISTHGFNGHKGTFSTSRLFVATWTAALSIRTPLEYSFKHWDTNNVDQACTKTIQIALDADLWLHLCYKLLVALQQLKSPTVALLIKTRTLWCAYLETQTLASALIQLQVDPRLTVNPQLAASPQGDLFLKRN